MHDPQLLRPAVFWDRDGTLIEDRGHLASPGDVVLFPDTIDALRRLRDRYLFFIVTNQQGVAEGRITLDNVRRVNHYLVSRLTESGLDVAAVYVCPHRRADACACIKPNPYFLHKAAEEFRVDLRGSYVVGDHPCDVELAERAGARGLYVCTGHGEKHRAELPDGVVVLPGIRAAADWILSRADPARGLAANA